VRIDLFLKITGLIKHRTRARDACAQGAVTVDGLPAKPGRQVRVGDRIRIAYPRRVLEVDVEALPEGSVPRSERTTYYRVVGETPRGWDE